MFHQDGDSALDENYLIKVLEAAERNDQDVTGRHSLKRQSSEPVEEDPRVAKWPRKQHLSGNECGNETTKVSSCGPSNPEISMYNEKGQCVEKTGHTVSKMFQIDNGGFEDDLELELELVSTVQNAEKYASGYGNDSSGFQIKGKFKAPTLTPQRKQTDNHELRTQTESFHAQLNEKENELLPTALSFGYENQIHSNKEDYKSVEHVDSNAPNMCLAENSASGNYQNRIRLAEGLSNSTQQAGKKETVSQHTPVTKRRSADKPRMKVEHGLTVTTPMTDKKSVGTGGSCGTVATNVANRDQTTPRGTNQQGQPETPSTAGTRTSSLQKKQRKFPGPAGILPKLKLGASLENLPVVETTPVRKPIKLELQTPEVAELPLSQSSQDCFRDPAWTCMVRDLEPQAGKVLQQFCVAAVMRKASRKLLPRGKVPAMGLLIETICTQKPDARVMLKDKTGSIGGTIHRQLMKEYPAQFQQGTVLLLRQIGVFSPSAKTHYLNITPNNLVKVYNRGESDQAVCTSLGEFTMEDMTVPSTSKLQTLDDCSSPSSLFMGQNSDLQSDFGSCIKSNGVNASKASGSVQLDTRESNGSKNGYNGYRRNNWQTTLPNNVSGTSPFVPSNLPSTSTYHARGSQPGTPVSSHSSSKRFSFRKPSQNVASPALTPARTALGGNSDIRSAVTDNNKKIMKVQVPATKQASDEADSLWEDDLDEVMSQMMDDVY